MDAAQKAHVRRETVVATCACSLLPGMAVAAVFEPFPVPLNGPDGLVAFAVKSTLVAVWLMTTLMTVATRARVAKGAIAPLSRRHFGWLAFVPRRVVSRAPLYAVSAALVMAAATAAVAGALHWAPLERPAFVAFNLVTGALIGMLMTPLIQCAALADPVAAEASAGAKTSRSETTGRAA